MLRCKHSEYLNNKKMANFNLLKYPSINIGKNINYNKCNRIYGKLQYLLQVYKTYQQFIIYSYK